MTVHLTQQIQQIQGVQGPAGPQGPQGPQGDPGPTTTGGGSGWKPEELGFFDPQLPASYGPGPMVPGGKDVYYRNVHLADGKERWVTALEKKFRPIHSDASVTDYLMLGCQYQSLSSILF